MRFRQSHLLVLAAAILVGIALYSWLSNSRDSFRTRPPLTEPNFTRVGALALYPDARRTPGATNAAVTQANILQTICVHGWTKTVRPSSAEAHRIKIRMMQELSVDGEPSDYELDHFIPLELGGCPDCIENFWLEPYSPEPGARQKDQVERYLHDQVCDGSMPLDEAQKAIASDWYRVFLEMHGTRVTESEQGEKH